MTYFYKQDKATILINEEITNENANDIVDFIYGCEFVDSIKMIEVIINSGGGSVTGGYSIFNALIASSKTVQTTIAGICASIAGIIFLAGQVRKMYNHSLFMVHNPSGGDDEILKLIKDSLMKILGTENFENLDELMTKETWFNSEMMEQIGIVNKENIIEITKEKIMKKELKSNVIELQKISNSIINNIFEKEIEEVKNEIPKEEIKDEETEEVKSEEVTEEVKSEEEIIEEAKDQEIEIEIEPKTEETEEETTEEMENPEVEELKKQIEDLIKKNEELEASLKNIVDIEESKEKEEILNKAGIQDKAKWMEFDLATIKDLTKTITIKSPKIELDNSKKEIIFKNLSIDEKKQLMEEDPKLYIELFNNSRKK